MYVLWFVCAALLPTIITSVVRLKHTAVNVQGSQNFAKVFRLHDEPLTVFRASCTMAVGLGDGAMCVYVELVELRKGYN